MTIKELRERFDAIGVEARSLLGAEATDETQAKVDALMEERESIKARIDALLKLDADDKAMGRPVSEPDIRTATAPEKVEVRKDYDNGDRPFAGIGDQLRSVAAAASPSGSVDKRLLRVHEEFRAATGQGESIPADGGFLVDQPLAAGLLKRMFEGGQLLQRVRRIPLGAGSNGIRLNKLKEDSRADGSRFGGVQGYWLAEAAALTASQHEFEQIELRLNKVGALLYATNELLADAPALESEVNANVPAELRFKVEDAIVNGSGVGKPLGFTQVGAYLSVAKESGQTADTVVAGNISKMWARFMGDRANAVWLVDASVLSQLPLMTVGDTPVWQPNFQVGPNGAVFGRPVVEIEHLSVLGDAGDIVLADLGQYAFIDKGLQGAVSMHVRFLYDEQAFRFTYRVDGQPVYKNALTPKSGGDTRSPFITVAART